MKKIMDYWEKKYRKLEKETEENQFISGCLTLIVIAITLIVGIVIMTNI